MEHEYRKSSNELSSAIFHILSSTDLSTVTKIRLCADGCGGQNRNTTMVAMCIYFLHNVAPTHVKLIELVFPIRGHSFLPSDRVFRILEKKLKKMPVITNLEDYIDLFHEHGTVHKLESCGVKDWKNFAKDCLKSIQSWHFKFSTAKRFFIEKKKNNSITVRGEEHYNVDVGQNKCVLKRGKKISHNVLISDVAKGVPVKPTKVKDIKTLLEAHFGEKWQEDEQLNFFKKFVEDIEQNNISNTEESNENEFCELMPEENLCLRI